MFSRIATVFASLFAIGHGMPDGAPSLSCSSMTPFHFTFEKQPIEECPFSVLQSKLHYKPGNDTVIVSLTTEVNRSNRTFKGFLVRALDPETNRPIGRFREDPYLGVRDRCSAATHQNPEGKRFVLLRWSSDDIIDVATPMVIFEATFVETFRKFYVAKESLYRGENARKLAKQALLKGKLYSNGNYFRELVENELSDEEREDESLTTEPIMITEKPTKRSSSWF